MKKVGAAVGNLSMFKDPSWHRSTKNSDGTPTLCWRCAQDSGEEELFCAQCQAIQGPGNKNSFEILGLPVSYALDLDHLEARYFSLHARVHPDRFVNASDQEKHHAQEQAIQLNMAYQRLKAPLKRAAYLLEVLSLDEALKEAQDTDFLLDIMKFQDRLETEKEAVHQEVAFLITQGYKDLEKAFADNDYGMACQRLQRLKYYERLQEQRRC